jgi:hypothetical protein
MNRDQLEHVIGAASTIADDEEIVVVGSQSILGQHPDAPAQLLLSNEADVFPKNKPDLAEIIEGSIGELSMFHDTFGYYAQGVAESTAVLPAGWRDRLVPVRSRRTRGATGWCLEVHDLVVSKLVAGRPKDLEFVKIAADHKLIEEKIVRDRLAMTTLEDSVRPILEARVTSIFGR